MRQQQQYHQVPTSEPIFDYTSPFSYSSSLGYQKSAFTYHSSSHSINMTKDERSECTESRISHWCRLLLIGLSYLLFCLILPFALCFYVKVIRQYERIVVFRLGKMQTIKNSGVVIILPCIDRWKKVDLRMRAFNVPPQQIVTADRGIIEVGANVFFRIHDIYLAMTTIQDLDRTIRGIGQTALVNLLQTKTHVDVENEKNTIINILQNDLNVISQAWGVEVSRVELSEIKVIKAASPLYSLGALRFLANYFPKQTVASSQPEIFVSHPDQLSEELSSPEAIVTAVRQLINISTPPLNGMFEIELLGTSNGIFYVFLQKDNPSEAGMGHAPSSPNVIINLTIEDLKQMIIGNLKPLNAFVTGRLKIHGDHNLAMQLGDWLKNSKRPLQKTNSEPITSNSFKSI